MSLDTSKEKYEEGEHRFSLTLNMAMFLSLGFISLKNVLISINTHY